MNKEKQPVDQITRNEPTQNTQAVVGALAVVMTVICICSVPVAFAMYLVFG